MDYFYKLGVKETLKVAKQLKVTSLKNYIAKLDLKIKKENHDEEYEQIKLFLESEEKVQELLKEYIIVKNLSFYSGNETQLMNMMLDKFEEVNKDNSPKEEL